MIRPRGWLATPLPYDYGRMLVNAHIAASQPDRMPYLGGLFFKQGHRTRRQNAYKGAATRLAQQFAARVGGR